MGAVWLVAGPAGSADVFFGSGRNVPAAEARNEAGGSFVLQGAAPEPTKCRRSQYGMPRGFWCHQLPKTTRLSFAGRPACQAFFF